MRIVKLFSEHTRLMPGLFIVTCCCPKKKVYGCKDDLVMPPLNVYYAIFHVFKRYSQQLVIYLLQFSLWFSSILSSDSGTSSPISSISISLTCLCFRLLTSSTRSLINGSASIVFISLAKLANTLTILKRRKLAKTTRKVKTPGLKKGKQRSRDLKARRGNS